MKHLSPLYLMVFILLYLNPSLGFTTSADLHPPFAVHQEYPYISLAKTQLINAETIQDLQNDHNKLPLEYQPGWVEKYISVEIRVCQDGNIKTATGKNEVFTKAQKQLLASADSDKEIHLKINYWPKNILKQNEAKEINFAFSIHPQQNAQYSGGKKALRRFLEEHAMKDISADLFQEFDMTAVRFSVGPTGEISEAAVFDPGFSQEKFDTINQQLLAAVRKMPRWEPAAYSDGTTTTQRFVFTVGNTQNCTLPLLNISL